jgi:hypothetical protein
MIVQTFTEPSEELPEGYSEALNDCTVLAANLLSQAVTGEPIKRCWDCISWVGRCKKGHVLAIARDKACNDFSSKKLREDNDAGN